ncbi:MAG: molybdopterin biosynthesis protein [Chloroflexota bacterium]
MSVYLSDVPLPEAQARWNAALESAGLAGLLGVETIPLDEAALGRVLAEPVWAKISSPHYHASAMDGFALRAVDTAGAMPTAPLTLDYASQTVYIDTGEPLPDWADAVVPIEDVETLNAQGEPAEDPRQPAWIRLRGGVTPWSNVRVIGEDIVTTELVLPVGQVLRPVDLGAIAACGHDRLTVARHPRVAIIPTGDELVCIGQPLKPGNIIEFNSLVLAAQIASWGGLATRLPQVSDEVNAIRDVVIEAACGHDLVLLLAGSSAGSQDFSAQVVRSLGELLVHGIAVRPGHPVILGMVQALSDKPAKGEASRRVPIIGVPGYPVSAALTGEIFVKPLLARWLGTKPAEAQVVEATLTRKVVSPPGYDDYLRVAVGRVGDRLLAAPLPRGAGVITSLVRADGIVVISRGEQGLPSGERVAVRLYCSLAEIEHTIFAIGSHDLTLDVLAQFLSRHDRRLTSSNVGSLGGLMALKREEAHLAGSHLLDPQTGEYNLAYIHRYIPDVPVLVVALVGREQGLLVSKGNPKGIQSLSDLVRPEVRFVNRQRGAGTRVLLDYHLERLGISPDEVQGYAHEEYTHLSVAAAVASGRVDCALGVHAAAQALDLSFIPLFNERYDLVIPRQHFRSSLLEPLLNLLADEGFRNAVAQLPGYDVSVIGTVIAELGSG